jgi:hypothetical protein
MRKKLGATIRVKRMGAEHKLKKLFYGAELRAKPKRATKGVRIMS